MRRLLPLSLLGLALVALGVMLAVRGGGEEARESALPPPAVLPSDPLDERSSRDLTSAAGIEPGVERAPAAETYESEVAALFREREARSRAVEASKPGVRVRVLHADGAPVDGIELFARAGDDRIATQRTDPEGRASLQDERPSRRSVVPIASAADADRPPAEVPPRSIPAVLGVDALLRDPIAVPFDLADFGQPPIEVRLPLMGGIRVHVETEDGRPFPLDRAKLRVFDVDALGTRTELGVKPVSGASLHLPFVETGRRFELRLASHAVDVAGPTFLGPARAGEIVDFTFRIDGDVRIAVGRLVNSKARSSSEDWVVTAVSDDGRWSLVAEALRSSFAGGVAVPLLESEIGFEPAALEFQTANGDRVARAVLPQELPLGRIDLGDLVIEPGPILVSGTVVDPGGEPLLGARVFVGSREPSKATWSSDPATDDSGEYVVRGSTPGSDARALEVWADGEDVWQEDPVLATPGSLDVRLVLTSRGALAVRALVPRTIGPQDIRIRTRPRRFGGEWASNLHSAKRIDRGDYLDRVWTVDGLPPGVTEVEVRHRETGELLAWYDDVFIESGGVTRDPRLDPLDLLSLVREYSLEFQHADGAPVSPGVVRWRPSTVDGSDEWSTAGRGEGASVLITTSEPVIDVLVGGAGCRTRLVEGVTDSRTIELDPGVPVRFVLPGGGGETLLARGIGSAWTPRTTLRLDDDGAATGALDPGRTSVWIANPTAGGPRAVEEVLIFDLPPDGAPQEIVLERLARALAEEGAER